MFVLYDVIEGGQPQAESEEHDAWGWVCWTWWPHCVHVLLRRLCFAIKMYTYILSTPCAYYDIGLISDFILLPCYLGVSMGCAEFGRCHIPDSTFQIQNNNGHTRYSWPSDERRSMRWCACTIHRASLIKHIMVGRRMCKDASSAIRNRRNTSASFPSHLKLLTSTTKERRN